MSIFLNNSSHTSNNFDLIHFHGTMKTRILSEKCAARLWYTEFPGKTRLCAFIVEQVQSNFRPEELLHNLDD